MNQQERSFAVVLPCGSGDDRELAAPITCPMKSLCREGVSVQIVVDEIEPERFEKIIEILRIRFPCELGE